MCKCRKIPMVNFWVYFSPFCYDLMQSAIWIVFTILLGSNICPLTKVKALSSLLFLKLFPCVFHFLHQVFCPSQNRLLKFSLLFTNSTEHAILPYNVAIAALYWTMVSLMKPNSSFLLQLFQEPCIWKGLVPVTVNFMCQLYWPQRIQIKRYFWACLWGCFWMRLTFESVDLVDCSPQRGWASSNPLQASIEQKLEEAEFCSSALMLEVGHLISSHLLPSDWDLHHLAPLVCSGLQTEISEFNSF